MQTSLAINRIQRISDDALSIHYAGTIVKAAKLDSVFAYKEIDAKEMNYLLGKTKKMSRSRWEKLKPKKELRLIKSGYLFVKLADGPSPAAPIKNRLLNLNNTENLEGTIVPGPANFILAKKKKPAYAVVNGFLIDLSEPASPVANTMLYQ